MSKQSLAMAYEMKRKSKKRMAKGGMIDESAATEKRPMPEEKDKDAHEVARNMAKKALVDSKATDRPELKQARHGLKTTPLKHPKMVHSDVLSARLRDEEDDLEMSAAPASPMEQPSEELDEKEAKKSGPSVPALEMKKMAEGGEIEDEEELEHEADIASAVMAKRRRMAKGGEVDLSENAMEQPNDFDELNEDALKENYDEELMDVTQPEDSNEHSPEHDMENVHDEDIISAIRSRMKKRSPITR
jgi:hypothetical protein